jgi:hypothetical protein
MVQVTLWVPEMVSRLFMRVGATCAVGGSGRPRGLCAIAQCNSAGSVGVLRLVEEFGLVRQHSVGAGLDEFAERRVVVHGPRE